MENSDIHMFEEEMKAKKKDKSYTIKRPRRSPSYEWVETTEKEKKCETCRKFVARKGEYTECRLYIGCSVGSYTVLVPTSRTPCGRWNPNVKSTLFKNMRHM